MEYEIVLGTAKTIHDRLKSDAPQGWILHTFLMSGMAVMEDKSEKPVFTAVLQRGAPAAQSATPERRFLGQKD